MFALDVQSSNLAPCELTVASRKPDHPKELQFRMFTAPSRGLAGKSVGLNFFALALPRMCNSASIYRKINKAQTPKPFEDPPAPITAEQ